MVSKGKISPGEALRNSGLPLEFAVSSILAEIDGLHPKGRYFYEREGATCETDIIAEQRVVHKSRAREVVFLHSLLFECEHRTRGKHWCFFPPAKSVKKESKNILYTDFIPEVMGLDKSKLKPLESGFFTNAPVVGDGTELYEGGNGQWNSNSQAISNAIRQVTLPIGNLIPHSLLLSVSSNWGKQGYFRFFTPVIVTTSKLQVLKDGVELEELSSFSEIESCFDERQSVFSVFITPTYIENYWRDRIRETLKDDSKILLQKLVSNPADFGDDQVAMSIIEDLAGWDRPTRVLILQFDALKSEMERYLGTFKEELFTCFDQFESS
ncbi:MAG: hypothetical protein E4H25_00025 [Methanomassiliicoccus sp.]|nr:MAG: hypothetical protein E4H25_00025 [Methanomassiliicoccus sp.]